MHFWPNKILVSMVSKSPITSLLHKHRRFVPKNNFVVKVLKIYIFGSTLIVMYAIFKTIRDKFSLSSRPWYCIFQMFAKVDNTSFMLLAIDMSVEWVNYWISEAAYVRPIVLFDLLDECRQSESYILPLWTALRTTRDSECKRRTKPMKWTELVHRWSL